MSKFSVFFVSRPSRHPANQKGYDSIRHCYREEYVNPKFWHVHLRPPSSVFAGEDNNGRPIMAVNIASLIWTVKQVRGLFEVTIPVNSSHITGATVVNIPAQGEYEITLQVNLSDGSSESNTKNFNFRDYLIVSIGDSFASGQGNPDVPAIPSIDEKAACKATTLLLSVTKLKDKLVKFLTGLKEEVKDKIAESIPYLGKVIVADINALGDLIGFVKDRVSDLKNVVVNAGKDVVGLAMESGEEVASWFGFGDGGESEEIQSKAAKWQEPKAYRSYRSGHSLAARQIETAMSNRCVTFLSFARTGSEIKDGLLGPRMVNPNAFGTESLDNISLDGWIGNKGQIQEAIDTVKNRPVDALIISIGVNDLGFSSLTSDSILWETGEKRKDRVATTEKKIMDDFPRNLQLLKDTIDNQLRPGKIFITEYPVGVYKEIETQGPCGVLGVKDRPILGKGFLDLDTSDAKALGALGIKLNNKIREKAEEFGWILVDGIASGFDGHGYCSKNSFFVFAEESCLKQGDFEGMLHPNELGHEVARDCIAKVLQRELFTREAPGQANWLEPVLHVMMT
ncbi:hypothetical protein M2273_000926 [Mucilaginibacter lappiensis]